jgi:flagellar biosynthesis protein FlhF
MYVRKFEADSLDEALKSIKRELGPDAIILKTVTNKGLKGAFKKNRIEITAAISEKNYTRKSRVDHALPNEDKEKFYGNSSSFISSMIDEHSDNKNEERDSRFEVKQPSYGSMGLNKSVQSVKDMGEKMKTGLDDFLSGPSHSTPVSLEQNPSQVEVSWQDPSEFAEEIAAFEEAPQVDRTQLAEEPIQRSNASQYDQNQAEDQKKKIDQLEAKLFELARSVERIDKPEPTGILQLRTTLRSLDIAENTINELIKKATFEFSKEDAQDVDLVFEYALREMLERIPTALPQFSNIDEEESAFVTLLLSDSSCGQTSMLYKLGALKKGSLLIQYQPGKQEKFAEKIFNLEVQRVESVAEIVSAVRKANEKGQSVFVDYRNFKTELNDTKKFIEGLRRSFGKVEVMICLSAIHSELYNRKVAATYESIADGMVVTNLDLCLNYGALFNVCDEFQGLPLKFFGTGDVIPEDIEAATGERVLAGMFKLD